MALRGAAKGGGGRSDRKADCAAEDKTKPGQDTVRLVHPAHISGRHDWMRGALSKAARCRRSARGCNRGTRYPALGLGCWYRGSVGAKYRLRTDQDGTYEIPVSFGSFLMCRVVEWSNDRVIEVNDRFRAGTMGIEPARCKTGGDPVSPPRSRTQPPFWDL
jgi:hypothetical protein